MNRRQRFALANPLTLVDPAAERAGIDRYQDVDRSRPGLLVLSTLAVDR